MSTAHKIQVLSLQECSNNIRTKGEGNTSVIFAPSLNISFGVRPKQITEQSRTGDIRRSNDAANLLHGLEIWAQTTVHAEDLFVNHRSNGEAVEAFCEGLP
jgi:hypothetical protein